MTKELNPWIVERTSMRNSWSQGRNFNWQLGKSCLFAVNLLVYRTHLKKVRNMIADERYIHLCIYIYVYMFSINFNYW